MDRDKDTTKFSTFFCLIALNHGSFKLFLYFNCSTYLRFTPQSLIIFSTISQTEVEGLSIK